MGKGLSEPNSQQNAQPAIVIPDAEKVVPLPCPGCGHVYLTELAPGMTKCPRCGYCMECV
jgi:predicted RNA-binding Zn-ribbon protein involved in translation (DUF1610 family)